MRLALLAMALLPRAVVAQPSSAPPTTSSDGGADYFPAPKGKDIVVHAQGERSTKNVAILASIAGAGALLGGIGLYYNLDSRSAADQISAHRPTGMAWSPALQATYDRAHDSGVKAGVFYGVGGALVIGAIVGMIVTQPGTETIVIHPHGQGSPSIAPMPGGAVLGGTWSF